MMLSRGKQKDALAPSGVADPEVRQLFPTLQETPVRSAEGRSDAAAVAMEAVQHLTGMSRGLR